MWNEHCSVILSALLRMPTPPAEIPPEPDPAAGRGLPRAHASCQGVHADVRTFMPIRRAADPTNSVESRHGAHASTLDDGRRTRRPDGRGGRGRAAARAPRRARVRARQQRPDRPGSPVGGPVGPGPDRGPGADRQRRRGRPHDRRARVAAGAGGGRGIGPRAHAAPAGAVGDPALPRPARNPRRAARRRAAEHRGCRRRGRRRRGDRDGCAGAAVLGADGGRGRESARLRRRLHRDVRLHARGAARQVGARPDPPRRPGPRRRGLAGRHLHPPRPADAPAPPPQGRHVDVGRHDAAQLPQPARNATTCSSS